ncbi:MAG: hypothetical protein QXR30_04020 [Candidatus Woesearchaeota archaeon]
MRAKILVSAQDVGGAVNIAPICSKLKSLNFNIKIIPSKITKDIFVKHNLNEELIELLNLNEDTLKKLFLEFKPNLILTGTTRYFSSDRLLIKISNEYNVFSISVLDDWTNYRLRFTENSNGLILPDIICCMDEIAYKDAILEGIPSKKLIITGSIYLSLLFNNKSNNDDKLLPSKILNIDGLNKDIPTILFISETLEKDFGNDQRGGKMGDFLGYTEKTVLQDIIEVLSEFDINCNLIEKLHPIAEFSGIKNFSVNKINYIQLKNYELHNLILNSDLVIGMRSIALLESAILNKLTISYQPNLNPKYGSCTAERIAKVESLRNKEELKYYIKNFFTKGMNSTKIYFSERPNFANKNAISNIVNLIIRNI